MSTTITLNSTSYAIPQEGDSGWATDVSNYLIALSTGVLSKSGGTFTLTADADFGATYGLKSSYIKSRGTNPSSTGVLRLANAESVSWRNVGNSADYALKLNSSNVLEFNSNAVIDSASLASTLASYALTTAVTDHTSDTTDAHDASAISFSPVGTIAATDAQTAIAEVATDAASALSSHESDTTSIHGIADTSDLNLKSTLTTKGDLYVATASATVVRRAVGTNGQVLTADSAETDGVKWATPSSNPVTTKGDLAGYGAAADRVPVGANNQYLMADSGSTLGLKYQPFFAPNIQKFTSGSGTYTLGYSFLISSGSATAGATYTNNGNTYTVLTTISSATIICLSGTSDPTSTGTLTKASGTGDSTLTFSAASKPKYIRVRMVGAGGGGSAGGTSGSSAATNGGDTTFGVMTANGGVAAAFGALSGAAGGSASLGSGPIGTTIEGHSGGGGGYMIVTTTTYPPSGYGGSSALFGGGGSSVSSSVVGGSGLANTGGGGAGGGGGNASSCYSGAGGGSGGGIDAIISSPSATHSYAIGSGGSGGTSAANGQAGGAGGSGYIEVTEFYQ